MKWAKGKGARTIGGSGMWGRIVLVRSKIKMFMIIYFLYVRAYVMLWDRDININIFNELFYLF